MIDIVSRTRTDLTDIAGVTGLNIGEAFRRWLRWTDVKTGLVISGRPESDRGEVWDIAYRPEAGVDG